MVKIGEGNFIVTRNTNDNMVITNTALKEPAIEVTKEGFVLEHHKPFFSGCLTSTQHNKTLNGVFARLIPDFISANVGGHYDPVNAQFTAPEDGVYFFNAKVLLTNLPSEPTNSAISINIGNKKFQDVNTSRDPYPYTLKASVMEFVRKGTLVWVDVSASVQRSGVFQPIGFGGNITSCLSEVSGILV